MGVTALGRAFIRLLSDAINTVFHFEITATIIEATIAIIVR
jgi:hypothetical protein